MSAVNQYGAQIYNVCNYLANEDKKIGEKRIIVIDTIKCLGIGASFAGVLRYCKGPCHYLKYLKWMVWGSTMGLCYSFYFTNQKVETFWAKSSLNFK